MKAEEIELTRIKNDSNGNPRYVAHYLDLIDSEEQAQCWEQAKAHREKFGGFAMGTSYQFDLALSKAKTIGGSKYRGKDFGGGIVFQSYNTRDLKESIIELRGN